jgi:hypothetical protein
MEDWERPWRDCAGSTRVSCARYCRRRGRRTNFLTVDSEGEAAFRARHVMMLSSANQSPSASELEPTTAIHAPC